MPLSIKDPEVGRLAREVAKVTGETLTAAIVQALRERLHRVRRMRGAQLSDDLLVIGRRCAALPILESRTPEQILGYDRNGRLG